MPRRRGLRLSAAPTTSLALVLSILIAFVALLSPAAADQPAAPAPDPSGEVPVTEAAPETPSGETLTPKAERLLRRAERKAERAAQNGSEAPAQDGAAARGGTGTSSKASRKAEKAAKKAARREAAADVKGATPSAASPSASSKKREHEERRRAHEEQRRIREEQRRASGHESKKERQERAAREAAEASAGSQGTTGKAGFGVTASSAVGGLAPAATPEAKSATAKTGSGAQAVQGEKSSRAPARNHRRGAQSGALTTGALPSAALGAAGGARSGAKPLTGKTRHVAPRHRHAAATNSSPLVTTVTRIIGVVPTAVWLLIGALALAAIAFATSSRVAERRARRLDQQRRELLEDVGLLQAALLPELPARLGAVSTTAAYRPASGPGAGGDFYDVFALDDGLVAVLVGDVSGHGRDALPHTTLLRYTLRAYLEAGLSPREAIRAAAPALERQLGGSFATVVLATYDPRARLLTYACAGHPHPLLTGLDPEAAIIASSAPPIGAGRPTGTRETVISIPGAAVAAFYTDGVIEARAAEELYGQLRLSADLQEVADGDSTAGALLDRVAAQTDRRPDDMAACLLGISGGTDRPRIISEQIELDGREAGRSRASRFLAAAGVPEAEIGAVLSSARSIAADHGSALLTIEHDEAGPRLTLTHDNVAPLRARALARTQEVAL